MRILIAVALFAIAFALPARAIEPTPVLSADPQTYSADEIVNAGHTFFGSAAGGLAGAIETIFARFGEPNGYILGEEGAGAFVGGLRYGEGAFQMRGYTPSTIFWQGPSVGWDFGGTGSRVMMLAYNVPNPAVMLQRFTGVDGSAYLVGGMSVTVMAADETVLIPVRTGLGARLGVSLGYLKFTSQPTWNPF
ncbi:MAG: EipA family protein [Pseudomonadota bacterium]